MLKAHDHIFQLIADTARELDYHCYVVGGYVRDHLLGRESKDMDILCVGNGIELARAVASKLDPAPSVNIFKRFGTAMFRYKEYEIEFVGARKESYRADSRKPVVENGSLSDDLNRRDFTINAMAYSLNPDDYGQLVDRFHGFRDLKEKIIRTPLEPGQTFSDDPLRMIRAIRFAAQLAFEIEPQTLNSIAANKNRIDIVSQERITVELNKILMAPKPSVGFILLFDTGLLHLIFPQLVALYGVDRRDGRAHKDNFYHTLQVVDNVAAMSDDIWLRWSALLHDIAKPATKRYQEKQGWTFHGHEVVGAKMVPDIFRSLKLPLNNKMKFVKKMVALHLRPIALAKKTVTDSGVRRLLFEAGEDIEALMTLCEADITSKNEQRVKRYLHNFKIVRQKLKAVEEKDRIRNFQPPVTGETIINTFNVKPGPQVGIIKNAIKDAILDGEIKNDYDEAYAFMLKKARELGLTDE